MAEDECVEQEASSLFARFREEMDEPEPRNSPGGNSAMVARFRFRCLREIKNAGDDNDNCFGLFALASCIFIWHLVYCWRVFIAQNNSPL